MGCEMQYMNYFTLKYLTLHRHANIGNVSKIFVQQKSIFLYDHLVKIRFENTRCLRLNFPFLLRLMMRVVVSNTQLFLIE